LRPFLGRADARPCRERSLDRNESSSAGTEGIAGRRLVRGRAPQLQRDAPLWRVAGQSAFLRRRHHLASHRRQSQTSLWVDLAKPDAAAYYTCVAGSYIDSGFAIIRFEAPVLVLRNSSDPAAAAKAYKAVHATLMRYADQLGRRVYFLGDPELAKHVRLDGILVPSRFYHTMLASALKYQNRIERPGIGVGYAHALSPLMVQDTLRGIPSGTKAFFAVANWDSQQDELQRFMELNPENRRFLIDKSAEIARQGGAHFVIPLDGCAGFTPPAAVVDRCEILKVRSTEYNSVRCGDLVAIRNAQN
jgi:hypothetical protein